MKIFQIILQPLRKLQLNVNMEINLKTTIHDQLVCGVRDEGITNKLLQEVDLDYTKARADQDILNVLS